MTKNKLQIVIIGIASAVLVGNIAFAVFFQKKAEVAAEKKSSITSIASNVDYVSYNGKDGIDALTILKEKTEMKQDASGLVFSINTRKADTKQQEYWAFYVNGKLSEVGPADYKTKNGDTIEWKIEKY